MPNHSLASRLVVLNPAVMFGERQKEAFRWACAWAFDVAKRGPGKKVFFCDELWKFVDAQSLPVELEGRIF